jgi:hypothetical protein
MPPARDETSAHMPQKFNESAQAADTRCRVMATVVEIVVAVASLIVALTFLAIPGLLVGSGLGWLVHRVARTPEQAVRPTVVLWIASCVILAAAGITTTRSGPPGSMNPSVELFYLCLGVAWATAGGYALWRTVIREDDPGRRPIEAPRPR